MTEKVKKNDRREENGLLGEWKRLMTNIILGKLLCTFTVRTNKVDGWQKREKNNSKGKGGLLGKDWLLEYD